MWPFKKRKKSLPIPIQSDLSPLVDLFSRFLIFLSDLLEKRNRPALPGPTPKSFRRHVIHPGVHLQKSWLDKDWVRHEIGYKDLSELGPNEKIAVVNGEPVVFRKNSDGKYE
jgi:hypothetical protein